MLDSVGELKFIFWVAWLAVIGFWIVVTGSIIKDVVLKRKG